MVFCFSAKYPFFKWCFALQQPKASYACIFFRCNGVLLFSKTFLLVCLVVSRCTCLLVCWLLVVFCFSAKYPFFKWCFACTCLLVCCLWYFAFQQNILSLNGALLYSKCIIRMHIFSFQWCFAFSKTLLFIQPCMLACLLLVD